MKRVSLIATVFNEAGLEPWLAAIAAQTRAPDEIVICDGGSSDGTFETLQRWASAQAAARVKIIQKPGCNIAAGRNAAIGAASGEVVVVSDAGAPPCPEYLAEMAKPFEAEPAADAVAGHFRFQEDDCGAPSTFRRAAAAYLGRPWELPGFLPSSRSVAFTREAWEKAGGYPEWLTLAAEDTLFNKRLIETGVRFVPAPQALVFWNLRPNLRSFLRMIARNAFGDAETGSGARSFYKTLLKLLVELLALAAVVLGTAHFCGYFHGALTAALLLPAALAGRALLRRVPPSGWAYYGALCLLGGPTYIWGYAKGVLLGKRRPGKAT